MHKAAGERSRKKGEEIMAKNTAIDEWNQASERVSSQIERVAKESLAAAQENVQAFVKAYEAQYQAGVDLLKKSTETLKELGEGDLAAKSRSLVDAGLENARVNADAWLDFAQESLGNVRRIVHAAIQSEQAA
jgi:hypothetical protein